VLDKILAYAIAHDRLDIRSIKQLIRNDFFEIMADTKKITGIVKATDIEGITRSCDYYEGNQEVTPL